MLRQERTQHVQESARRPVWPEQKDQGVKGCVISYISFHHSLLRYQNAVGPEGPLGGKERAIQLPLGLGPRTHCRRLHRYVESDGCR